MGKAGVGWGVFQLNNTEPKEVFLFFFVFTHMQLDRSECVFQCNFFVSVCIYIVPLTIICTHNLKGKYVRLFVFWPDALITASFLLSKVLFYSFFYQVFFSIFSFLLLLIACTVFKRSHANPLWGGTAPLQVAQYWTEGFKGIVHPQLELFAEGWSAIF